ncbi:MAG TPA: hypothetical protein VE693_11280 [Gaiellaceae bacterium]|jgi:hypothetical protein|nr:hypothetical protein [Gaiellaceae bacterium]
MALAFPRPGARLIHALDVAAVLWIAGWVVLAVFVAREVRQLRDLSDTVVTAGVAVEDTGDLLGSLQDVPLVGGRVAELAGQVRAAGESAQASGRDSGQTTEDLSVLLALAIGLIPTFPLLGLYAPLRITWTRESRAIRRSLASAPHDRVRDEYLARSAVVNLSYRDLQAISTNPFKDLEEGRFEALADRELQRLGLRRPLRLSGYEADASEPWPRRSRTSQSG